MIEPNNGQNQQQLRPQTKAEIVAQREQSLTLAGRSFPSKNGARITSIDIYF